VLEGGHEYEVKEGGGHEYEVKEEGGPDVLGQLEFEPDKGIIKLKRKRKNGPIKYVILH
jgi:hypothetical protein